MTTADSFPSVISPWTLDPGGESSLFPSYNVTESTSNLLTRLTTKSTDFLETLLPGSTTVAPESPTTVEETMSTVLTTFWTIASNVTSTAIPSTNATSSDNGTNSSGYTTVWTGGHVGGVNEGDDEMPVYLRITTLIFLLVIFVVGTVGNSMVILVIHCSKEMKTSTNIFLLNLSLADLLVLIICVPTCIAEVAYDPDVWMWGSAMCKLVSLLEVTVANVSVLTILAISLERYYAICCPLRANYVCTKTRAFVICFSAWVLAALVTSPMYRMVQYEEYGDTKASCDLMVGVFWADFYTVTSNVVFFLLPFFILLVTYALIARNLSSNRSRVCLNHSSRNIKARQQVIMMLGTVVFTFFLCLLPFRGFTLAIVFTEHSSVIFTNRELYYNILYFSRIMLYLNSALNPILYNIMSSKFRNGFLILCSKKRRKMYRLQRRGTFLTMTTTSTASTTSNLPNNFVHSAIPTAAATCLTEMRRACSNRMRAAAPGPMGAIFGGHQQHHHHGHCCCGCHCGGPSNMMRRARDQNEIMDPLSHLWDGGTIEGTFSGLKKGGLGVTSGGGVGGGYSSISMNNLQCNNCLAGENPLAMSSWDLATVAGGGDKGDLGGRGLGNKKCVCYVVNAKGKNGGTVTRAGHLMGAGTYISISCPGCLKKRRDDLLFWKNDANTNKDGQKFCVRMAMKTNCYACAYSSTFQGADTIETIL